MKKRIIAVLVCAVLFITSLPLTLIAATTRSIDFYIAANASAGLSSKLDVKNVSSLSATTYDVEITLPANADTSSLKLSWTSSNITAVRSAKSTNTRYNLESGKVDIPAFNDSKTIYVYLTSSSVATFTFTTVKSNSISFYVGKNTSAGLNEDIIIKNVDALSASTYTADINVPAGADISKLKISWESNGVSYVKKQKTTSTSSTYLYTSGNVAVPTAGNSITMYVYDSKNNVSIFTFTTVAPASINFYVGKNTSAGLNEDLVIKNVETLSATTYTADIVLPISATASSLKISWRANGVSYVKKQKTTSTSSTYLYTSGNVAIPAADKSITMYVYDSKNNVSTFIFTTKQESVIIPELKFTLTAPEDAGFPVTSYTANEVKSSASEYNETFKYLPGGTAADYSKLMLSWTNADKVILKDKDGNTVVSGETPADISENGVVYTSTFYNADRSYSLDVKYNIKVMHGSKKVSALNINIDESKGTISAMNTDQNHETECYGKIDIDGKSYFISIKGRGNYTWYDPGQRRFQDKKPYNFTLMKDDTYEEKIDKKQELVPGAKSKKWSLLANYADSSLLRNKIGYDLADKMGIGLKSKFVDVWMNGEFLGNYLLTPKSDYQASDDGYLLEYDNKKEKDGGDIQFKLDGIDSYGTSSYNLFTIKDFGKNAEAEFKAKAIEAGLPETDAYKYIQSWMQEMLNAVNDTETDDYLKYIDVDSWAKMYIIYELVKNYDVISGSQFMYREGTGEGDKLYAGPIWDLDNAFDRSGNCDYDGITNTTLEHSASGSVIDAITQQSKTFSLLQALGMHADFMERVYQLYNDYKSDINALSDNVESLKNDMSESVKMNFDRWDVNQTKYNNSRFTSAQTFDSGKTYQYKRIATTTYENYVTNLQNYLKARANYFEVTWGVTNPAATVMGETTYFAGETVTLTATAGYDSYKWQLSKNGTKWNDIEGVNTNVYTVSADKSLDGKYIRCIVEKIGGFVSATNVKTVKSSALTYASPEAPFHIHIYEDVVVLPTDTEDGYTAKKCSCGLEKDKQTLQKIIYGDANLDGKVNVSDCVSISLYLAEDITFDYRQFAAADVNCDSKVDKDDSALISKYILNIVSSFK